MKNKTNKYHNVGTVSKSNRKIVERGKFNIPDLEQALQYKVAGLKNEIIININKTNRKR